MFDQIAEHSKGFPGQRQDLFAKTKPGIGRIEPILIKGKLLYSLHFHCSAPLQAISHFSRKNLVLFS
jgi:hypothetical protein